VASEELEQRYPSGIGDVLGSYEVFETQLVTLNQYAEHAEIGETRDAKRFPERSDLPELVQCYHTHAAGLAVVGVERAAVVSASELYGAKSVNIRHHWGHGVARKLGLVGQDEDPAEKRTAIDKRILAMSKIVEEWEETKKALVAPDMPSRWRRVKLGEAKMFKLRIGKRVLKKDVYKSVATVPLYSANIRKPFGVVAKANAGSLEHGGALWSIDSDFDCRGVAPVLSIRSPITAAKSPSSTN
jgi:type I restriction enzyme M protein